MQMSKNVNNDVSINPPIEPEKYARRCAALELVSLRGGKRGPMPPPGAIRTRERGVEKI